MRVEPLATAAVMHAAGTDLELRQFPVPAAPPGGAVVRVHCCTICRSDLHTWMGRRPGPVPAILGHEIVGSLAALGAGCERDASGLPLRVGDRVTWTLHSSCGQCVYCRDFDLPMKCLALRKYGHQRCDEAPHLRGGLAEICVLDAGTAIVRIPDAVGDLAAAPANCAVATAVAGCEAAGLQPGGSVLLQGAGALGCYAAAYAARRGCARIIATDVSAERLAFIRRFGATDCIDMSACTPEDFLGQVAARTQGLGVDAALELAGAPDVVDLGLRALRTGGRYVEIGCCFPDARASLDLSLILHKRLTLCGLHNYDVRHLVAAIELLAGGGPQFPFAELVGRQFPLADVNRALRAAESRAAFRVAVLCGPTAESPALPR